MDAGVQQVEVKPVQIFKSKPAVATGLSALAKPMVTACGQLPVKSTAAAFVEPDAPREMDGILTLMLAPPEIPVDAFPLDTL